MHATGDSSLAPVAAATSSASGRPQHVFTDRVGQRGQPVDDRIGAVQADGPLGEGVGDRVELGRKAFPGKRQPGPHGPAGLDPLPGIVAGDLGDPLNQLRTVAAALPGGQATLAQLVPGGLRHLPRGQHPQRVQPAAGPLGRAPAHPAGRPRTGRPARAGPARSASCSAIASSLALTVTVVGLSIPLFCQTAPTLFVVSYDWWRTFSGPGWGGEEVRDGQLAS